MKYADSSLKRDKAFVLAAVAQNSSAFEYADASLKEDKEFVLAVVTKDGELLEHAGQWLKKDREIVLAAATASKHALRYAHAALRMDQDIIRAVGLRPVSSVFSAWHPPEARWHDFDITYQGYIKRHYKRPPSPQLRNLNVFIGLYLPRGWTGLWPRSPRGLR